MPKSEIDELRLEIGEIAGKIHRAEKKGDWVSFHLNLGMIFALAVRLYDENAKAEMR